jgi:hypothetical protein
MEDIVNPDLTANKAEIINEINQILLRLGLNELEMLKSNLNLRIIAQDIPNKHSGLCIIGIHGQHAALLESEKYVTMETALIMEPNSSRDQNVGALMHDFYAQEMPDGLREMLIMAEPIAVPETDISGLIKTNKAKPPLSTRWPRTKKPSAKLKKTLKNSVLRNK